MNYQLHNGILFNIHQAYNFFCLQDCNSIKVYEKPFYSIESVCAQLPNNRYVRYTIINNSSIEAFNDQLEKDYLMKTPKVNGFKYLIHKLNLEIPKSYILNVYCSEGKVCVMFKIDDDRVGILENVSWINGMFEPSLPL